MLSENFAFYSRGLRCDARLSRPNREGPNPCIVMAHGFGGIRAAGLDRFAERFADAGYMVLAFDYRHWGASEGEPRGLIDFDRRLDDYRAAIAVARSTAGVDPDQIVLWGTSLSGGHVLDLAAEDPRIAAAISMNPFTDGPAAAIATMRAATPATLARLALAYLEDQARRLLGRQPRRVNLVGPPGSFALFTSPDALPGFTNLVPEAAIGWEESVPARVLCPRSSIARRRTHHIFTARYSSAHATTTWSRRPPRLRGSRTEHRTAHSSVTQSATSTPTPTPTSNTWSATRSSSSTVHSTRSLDR